MAGGGKGQVFRGPVARWFGYVWLAFAALNLADIAWRGDDRAAVISAAALLAGTAVVYAVCLRPCIRADEVGVRVRNPLRETWAPWEAVDHVDATDAIRIHTGQRVVRCWVLPAGNLSRARAVQPPAAGARQPARGRTTTGGPSPQTLGRLSGRTRSDYVAGELDAMASRHRGGPVAGDPGSAVVRWSPWPLAALGGSLVLLVLSIFWT